MTGTRSPCWLALLVCACGEAPAGEGTADSSTSGATAETSTTASSTTSTTADATGEVSSASTTMTTSAETNGTSESTGAPPDCGGRPIEAPADAWTWVSFPETACALDGTAGIVINPAPAGTKLLIALEGGGACFSEADCESGRMNGIDDAELIGMLSASPLFDRTSASNPFAEYSWVFVPYCTGDFHSGDNVTDWGARHVGYTNLGAFLDRIVPTFCDVDQVVLTGFSAGGFGTTFNYTRVHERFPDIPVDMIDDSGPYLRPPWMPEAAQSMFDDSWGYKANLPPDCDTCQQDWHELWGYASARWPDDRMSLISSRYDPSIQERFAPYGALDSLDAFAIAIDTLADEILAPLPNVHVFYIEDEGHVWLPSGSLDQLVVDGTSLEQFVRAQIDDDPRWTDVRP